MDGNARQTSRHEGGRARDQGRPGAAARCLGRDISEGARDAGQAYARLAGAEQRTTRYGELEARTIMRRVQLAVEDGDSDDVAAAVEAWRQAARLAGRSQRQARQIADDLDHATS